MKIDNFTGLLLELHNIPWNHNFASHSWNRLQNHRMKAMRRVGLEEADLLKPSSWGLEARKDLAAESECSRTGSSTAPISRFDLCYVQIKCLASWVLLWLPFTTVAALLPKPSRRIRLVVKQARRSSVAQHSSAKKVVCRKPSDNSRKEETGEMHQVSTTRLLHIWHFSRVQREQAESQVILSCCVGFTCFVFMYMHVCLPGFLCIRYTHAGPHRARRGCWLWNWSLLMWVLEIKLWSSGRGASALN